MNEPPSTPSPSQWSFPQVAGFTFGLYAFANLLLVCMMMDHMFRDPISILFMLSFVGPPVLAGVLIVIWFNKARPNRSVIMLILFLAGTAGIAWLNLLCLASAANAV